MSAGLYLFVHVNVLCFALLFYCNLHVNLTHTQTKALTQMILNGILKFKYE